MKVRSEREVAVFSMGYVFSTSTKRMYDVS